MRNLKRQLLFLALCAAFLAGNSSAGVIGPLGPASFNDTVDWCQFGCVPGSPLSTVVPLASPQTWVSTGGNTGAIALALGGNAFFTQQGGFWGGNFNSEMGLIYNNACCGGTSDNFLVAFDQAEYGVGAYIQADSPGAFTGTVSLYDASQVLLGSIDLGGVSDTSPGGAIFVGATSTDPVWFAQFTVSGTTGLAGPEPDFAIGTMSLNATAPCSGGGDDKGHVGEFDAVLPLETGLLALAQANDARHIDFVDGVDMRADRHALDHALGDDGAHFGERNQAARCGLRHLRCGRLFWMCYWGGRAVLGQMAEDIFLGDTAIRAGA